MTSGERDIARATATLQQGEGYKQGEGYSHATSKAKATQEGYSHATNKARATATL